MKREEILNQIAEKVLDYIEYHYGSLDSNSEHSLTVKILECIIDKREIKERIRALQEWDIE
jgi:hypothetical protein